MELLIVRHAIAFERDPRRWPDDGERPLTPRGVARARKAAAGMKQLMLAPGRVLVSPLTRTRQTAAILTEVAGWPDASQCAELAPGGSPEALLALLRRTREPTIALVGHEPGLGRLLALSLPGTVAAEGFTFSKMGAAFISFPGAARAGQARVEWLVPARILRAAR